MRGILVLARKGKCPSAAQLPPVHGALGGTGDTRPGALADPKQQQRRFVQSSRETWLVQSVSEKQLSWSRC